jgi:hypothetical protein
LHPEAGYSRPWLGMARRAMSFSRAGHP